MPFICSFFGSNQFAVISAKRLSNFSAHRQTFSFSFGIAIFDSQLFAECDALRSAEY